HRASLRERGYDGVPPFRSLLYSAEQRLRFGELLGVDELELAGGLSQGHAHDIGAAKGDHRAEVRTGNRVQSMQAEARGQPAVESRRGAAALQVSQHNHPSLPSGPLLDLTRHELSCSAQWHVTSRVGRLSHRRDSSPGGHGALRYHDDGSVTSGKTLFNMCTHRIDVIGTFGNEDLGGPRCHAAM